MKKLRRCNSRALVGMGLIVIATVVLLCCLPCWAFFAMAAVGLIVVAIRLLMR
ncbi:MAG: hypothetical protein Q4C01_03125 [Clostridia bacterium]|nr:hypothetical protein [Clostridia bacterium]